MVDVGLELRDEQKTDIIKRREAACGGGISRCDVGFH